MSLNISMEPFLPQTNIKKISQFENAVFYCINESAQKLPVGVVRNFSFLSGNRLEFSLSNFPVLENNWNIFAAELHFYKKGLSFNITAHGTAWFVNQDELKVQFKILHTELAGRPELKPYSLQDSLYGFLSNTGLLFKKIWVTGF